MNKTIAASSSAPPRISHTPLVSLGYFLAAWVATGLTRETGNVAAIWPSNAILLGVLLRARPGQYGYYIAGCSLADLITNLTFGDSLLVSTGFVACNLIETITAFALMRRILPSGWSFQDKALLQIPTRVFHLRNW